MPQHDAFRGRRAAPATALPCLRVPAMTHRFHKMPRPPSAAGPPTMAISAISAEAAQLGDAFIGAMSLEDGDADAPPPPPPKFYCRPLGAADELDIRRKGHAEATARYAAADYRAIPPTFTGRSPRDFVLSSCRDNCIIRRAHDKCA